MKQSLSSTQKNRLPSVIAVTGCDGSGKSTLTNDIYKQLQKDHKVELIYLGQSSGNIGDWIKNLKVIGPALGRYLQAKAKKVHNKKDQASDNLTSLVIYLLSRWRLHKFRRMLKLCRQGVIVITDRYPQAEQAGFYFDGTGLGILKSETWFAKKLEKKERKLYEWMASYQPTLVIRLNIDAETAQKRKPDHKLKMLEDKIAVIPYLKFNGANILDLDSREPYEKVYKSAMSEIMDVIINLKRVK